MAKRRLLQDLFILGASILLAITIVHFGVVHTVLSRVGDGVLVASFVAGMFFTSLLSTAPAIAVLGELAQEGNIFLVALIGGAGAVIGDYILFMFVRDRVSADATYLLRGPKFRRALYVFKNRHFRRVLPVVGALIIASPLPDELGLTLLGLSSIRSGSFILVSYAMNTLGILIIGFIARGMLW